MNVFLYYELYYIYVCVCVCVCERERERERECVCVCARARVILIVCIIFFIFCYNVICVNCEVCECVYVLYKYNIILYNLTTKKYRRFVTCVYCYHLYYL